MHILSPIVKMLVIKHLDSPNNYDDLIQAGNIGYLKAKSSFNPNSGRTLKTWEYFCVEKGILSEKARLSPYTQAAYWGREERVELVSFEEIEAPSYFFNPVEDITKNRQIELVRKRALKLPDQKKQIILLTLEGNTPEEIAEIMQIKPDHARAYKTKAVQRIKSCI